MSSCPGLRPATEPGQLAKGWASSFWAKRPLGLERKQGPAENVERLTDYTAFSQVPPLNP